MTFELLGTARDELRLLVDPATGYSLALGGHPALVADDPVVVRLGDVPVELGLRIEVVPASIDPKALALATTSAYVKQRSDDASVKIKRISDDKRPLDTVAGTHAIYRVRGTDADPVMEQLYLLLRATSDDQLWALHQTTRFRSADLDVFEWAHLRAAIFDQSHWDPAFPRDIPPPTLWPRTSAFAVLSAKLDLTADAWRGARAKAEAIGELEPHSQRALFEALMTLAQSDDPPRHRLPKMVIDYYTRHLSAIGPAHATDVLLRDLSTVETMHDFRAWAWQGFWAIARRDRLVTQR